MANDRLINSTQGESIITGLNIIATKLDSLKPVSAADNGKVVVNGELTAQTSTTKTANGTYNTTTNNEVIVDVANSYSQSDNGKVVSNQQLVSQTAYPTTITENDTYDTTNYNSITVNVSGGGGSGGSDVIFYDYDGTVVASYSAADFANLSAMPANPTHTGLTAQGWNWSLSDAKAYVASYGKLNIGQMYITSDGKTRIYCVITEDDLSPILYLNLNDDTELDIDWGDNSDHTTWTSGDGADSESHDYSDAGSYTISITVVSGSFEFSPGHDSETYFPRKIELGTGITNIGSMYYFVELTSITIPNGVTEMGTNALSYCNALSSVTLPNGVTTIEDDAFSWSSALSSISIPSSVTSIESNAFCSCSALSSITIPSSVTSIGSAAFYDCSALPSITIPTICFP